MKQIGPNAWEVTPEDVTDTAVEESEDRIAFKPEGAIDPLVFTWGGSCGCQNSPSVGVMHYDHGRFRGGCVLTHEQARRLLAFLKRHEAELTDPAPKAGDVQESRLL